MTPVIATLKVAPTAVGGTSTEVVWRGPNNRDDRLVVVPVGTPEGTSSVLFITWLSAGSPCHVKVPEKPGDYEVRYFTGTGAKTLARAKITVAAAAASIAGPVTARAGESFEVTWTGPGDSYDHIAIFPKDGREGPWHSHAFVTAGSPMRMQAPLDAGEYDLRYLTAQSQSVLARVDLHVTPVQRQPGFVRVSAAAKTAESGGAIEVILDTSGSMLQRIHGKRRIEIAKRTLTGLTSKVIPAGTPFALRVFGRGSNSCTTDLDIPVRPLDVAVAHRQIAALAARNNAKTPIAASLAKVRDDLPGVKGERLIILITDGEETCGGDPTKAIEALQKDGVQVRVNIVGFAVDEAKTANTFRVWSKVGGGAYFDARDAAGLDHAVALALAPAFEIVDGHQQVVASGIAGGDGVQVMPGTYVVRLKGPARVEQTVTVREKETTRVRL